MSTPSAPSCFVSYAWESPQHRDWVLRLALDLTENGVRVLIDREVKAGESLTLFMEASVRESTTVVLVCTPTYAAKANDRLGGVGNETGIVTGEIFTKGPARKFVPIVRSGPVADALPSYLSDKRSLDFRSEADYEEALAELVRVIWDEPGVALPTPGTRPRFGDLWRPARHRPGAEPAPPPSTPPARHPPRDEPTVLAGDGRLPTAPLPPVTSEQAARLTQKSEVPVVVEFWAPWCGPCRILAPVIEEVATEYSLSTRFTRLNIDVEQQFAADHKVLSIPTTMVFRRGEMLTKVVGALPAGRFREALAPYIGEPNARIEARSEALALTLQDGRFRVAVLRPDGTYSFVSSDERRLGLVYLPFATHLSSAVDELEALLNDSYSTKEDIRAFLDEHQEVILGADYRAARSRVLLQRSGREALAPDFVLEPVAGELADIVEIQPAHERLADDIDGIAQMTEVVVEACARLREYRDYFEDESRRVEVEDEHGLKLFRPRLFFIIGRSTDIDELSRKKLESQINEVRLRSWDEVLAVARRRLGSP
jgi:thioredoxin